MNIMNIIKLTQSNLLKADFVNGERRFVTRQYVTFSNSAWVVKLCSTNAHYRTGSLNRTTLVSYILLPLHNADSLSAPHFF